MKMKKNWTVGEREGEGASKTHLLCFHTEKYTNLDEYMGRIKTKYYPDWEELLTPIVTDKNKNTKETSPTENGQPSEKTTKNGETSEKSDTERRNN